LYAFWIAARCWKIQGFLAIIFAFRVVKEGGFDYFIFAHDLFRFSCAKAPDVVSIAGLSFWIKIFLPEASATQ
jgi:hypothetical protein